MPSPIGHALAGLAVACTADRLPHSRRLDQRSSRVFFFSCAALAVFPDLDLLYIPIHRTITHSFAATGFVTIVAAAVTGWVTGRIDWRVALACGSAHLSHILLDWLGQDLGNPVGLQILWPFSDRWFISGWDVFRATQRRDLFSVSTMIHNFKTAALEILTFGPIILALRFAGRPPTNGQARARADQAG